MTNLVRASDFGAVIAMPPANLTPESAAKYLNEVQEGLAITLRHPPANGRMYRIDLENGRRGGYFQYPALALTEILTEVVDLARSPTQKSLPN